MANTPDAGRGAGITVIKLRMPMSHHRDNNASLEPDLILGNNDTKFKELRVRNPARIRGGRRAGSVGKKEPEGSMVSVAAIDQAQSDLLRFLFE